MGRRDYRHREPKKARKDAKKLPPVSVLKTPVRVEVIKKERKKREGEEAGE
jgi:ribosomal protein L13E